MPVSCQLPANGGLATLAPQTPGFLQSQPASSSTIVGHNVYVLQSCQIGTRASPASMQQSLRVVQQCQPASKMAHASHYGQPGAFVASPWIGRRSVPGLPTASVAEFAAPRRSLPLVHSGAGQPPSLFAAPQRLTTFPDVLQQRKLTQAPPCAQRSLGGLDPSRSMDARQGRVSRAVPIRVKVETLAEATRTHRATAPQAQVWAVPKFEPPDFSFPLPVPESPDSVTPVQPCMDDTRDFGEWPFFDLDTRADATYDFPSIVSSDGSASGPEPIDVRLHEDGATLVAARTLKFDPPDLPSPSPAPLPSVTIDVRDCALTDPWKLLDEAGSSECDTTAAMGTDSTPTSGNSSRNRGDRERFATSVSTLSSWPTPEGAEMLAWSSLVTPAPANQADANAACSAHSKAWTPAWSFVITPAIDADAEAKIQCSALVSSCFAEWPTNCPSQEKTPIWRRSLGGSPQSSCSSTCSYSSSEDTCSYSSSESGDDYEEHITAEGSGGNTTEAVSLNAHLVDNGSTVAALVRFFDQKSRTAGPRDGFAAALAVRDMDAAAGKDLA